MRFFIYLLLFIVGVLHVGIIMCGGFFLIDHWDLTLIKKEFAMIPLVFIGVLALAYPILAVKYVVRPPDIERERPRRRRSD